MSLLKNYIEQRKESEAILYGAIAALAKLANKYGAPWEEIAEEINYKSPSALGMFVSKYKTSKEK